MTSQTVIARFADTPVEIEAELDRRTLLARELLELAVGSVLRLPRSAGENIDLYLGGALMASGEIVVIEDRLGVRITDFKDEE